MCLPAHTRLCMDQIKELHLKSLFLFSLQCVCVLCSHCADLFVHAFFHLAPVVKMPPHFRCNVQLSGHMFTQCMLK